MSLMRLMSVAKDSYLGRMSNRGVRIIMRMSFGRGLLVAGLLSAMALAGNIPAHAQETGQPPAPAQTPPAQDAAPAPAQTAPAQPARTTPLSLQLSKHNFSRAPRALPLLYKPYLPIKLEATEFTNSLRIDQMVHDGKLALGLQDVIELALENNLDIVIQRYNPWIADTDILRTLGGGTGRGLTGTGTASTLGSIPPLNFDPTLTSTLSFDDRNIPVNNPFLSGTGSSGLASLTTHTTQFNNQLSQGFWTGTGVAVSWNNTRSSSSSPSNLFDPSVQSSLYVSVQQQLLNGFGLLPNTRNIRIAKNNRKIADLQFQQSAITTITNVINAYWELVYARENVKVQERAVEVAEKLYSDNKKQVEIGTMAPIDVVRAESEVASNRQNFIVAQTALLQQQQVLLNAISKNPLDASLIHAEIVPAEAPQKPGPFEAATFEEALKEAFANRPDLQQQEYNLKNAEISRKATRNALLPVLTVGGQYGSIGLSGNSSLYGPASVIAGSPVVDANGVPVIVLDQNNNPVPIFLPATSKAVTGTAMGGFSDAMSQVFHNRFPDYAVQFSLSIPLRNRQAQADNQRAMLVQRQLEAQVQQTKNAALLDVRNTYIALEQNRARYDAAEKARILQEQTFDAEQKKYKLGASTVFLVIQTQRDLTAAQGNEVRALVDLLKARADYERAVGRTLDVHNITVAGLKSGDTERETLIPGTLNGEVVGTHNSAQ